MTRLGWIRKLKDERATAVVEMALVLPILLLLSLGILDFGRAMNYKNDATQLANVAARYAAVNRNPSNPLTTLPDCATLKTWLETQADTPEMQTMLNNGTLTIGLPDGTTVGGRVTITLDLSFSWLSFVSKDALGGAASTSLKGLATMRIEQPADSYSGSLGPC